MRSYLELSESDREELEKLQHEAEATRQKLSQQEREIELKRQDAKERNLKRERARELERQEREKAAREAARFDAVYVESDGENEPNGRQNRGTPQATTMEREIFYVDSGSEDETNQPGREQTAKGASKAKGKDTAKAEPTQTEWPMNQTEPRVEDVPDDLRGQEFKDSLAAVQPQPGSDEKDELEEEKARLPEGKVATAERRKPSRTLATKGQLMLDEQACERCRVRRQSCHKQESQGRIICYECSKQRKHCSWASVKPRKQRIATQANKVNKVNKANKANKMAGPSERTDGETSALSTPSTQPILDQVKRLEDRIAFLEASGKKKEPASALRYKLFGPLPGASSVSKRPGEAMHLEQPSLKRYKMKVEEIQEGRGQNEGSDGV
ncbi:hypothetical protein FB45DRAFT_908442 [Roridomyces roridus]|uniref:Zn(2)-C6 fungal-type domain-containing protein n=1 Tax=Roridomyces roridus TaxID=1738132 RepID=A0AAD7C2J5_9AGAR|nr:hypothetical protein FB45DRAFT_908442 [Roridomyces roridus]